MFERKMVAKAANGIGDQMLKAISAADQQGNTVLDSERSKAKRLAEATIGADTLKRMKHKVNKSEVLGSSPSSRLALAPKKPAALSQMRASTNNTYLTRAMFAEIDKTLDLLKKYLKVSPYGEMGFVLEAWMMVGANTLPSALVTNQTVVQNAVSSLVRIRCGRVVPE
jgi:hypothetical protein